MIKRESAAPVEHDALISEIVAIVEGLRISPEGAHGPDAIRRWQNQIKPILVEAAELLRAAVTYKTPAAFRGGLSGWQNDTVRRYIQAHIGAKPTLADLAASVRLSTGYFSQAFKHTFDCSPMEYVRRERVKVAKSLLEHSTLSLNHIAFECGFTDQAHLTKTFQLYFSTTPRRWRLGFRGLGRLAPNHIDTDSEATERSFPDFEHSFPITSGLGKSMANDSDFRSARILST